MAQIVKQSLYQLKCNDIGVQPKLYDKDKKILKKKPKPPTDSELFVGVKGKPKRRRRYHLSEGEKLLCGEKVINKNTTILEKEKRKRLLLKQIPRR